MTMVVRSLFAVLGEVLLGLCFVFCFLLTLGLSKA